VNKQLFLFTFLWLGIPPHNITVSVHCIQHLGQETPLKPHKTSFGADARDFRNFKRRKYLHPGNTNKQSCTLFQCSYGY